MLYSQCLDKNEVNIIIEWSTWELDSPYYYEH